MRFLKLSWLNITGSAFRSWAVALCAFLVAGFALATTLVARGAEDSLRLAIDRLGADIIVVPEGELPNVENALLMGGPIRMWMPENKTTEIGKVPGVAKISPQLYLSTLNNAECCSVSDMFLIAYDPATDFTVRPWLLENIGRDLNLGEVVGGTYIFTPEGAENILIYNYLITLRANMEPTGTGLDQSMFLTFETAYDIARISESRAVSPLVIPEDSISAVMVKLEEEADPEEVAVEIMHAVPGVTPIASMSMFQAYRQQLGSLLRAVLLIMAITLGMSVLMIALVFSMAANERRRELGVLRAMGATHGFVFRSLLTEAGMLALLGGAAGILITVLAVYLFHNFLVDQMGVPFLLPSLPALAGQVLTGLGLALGSVVIAAMIPAYRISRMDPASAMRE